jgi:hypothetical protein
MRTGRVVVYCLIAATFGIATGAWFLQRGIMQRHKRKEAPAQPAVPSATADYERRAAPGGIPAVDEQKLPEIAAAPGGVPVEWADKNLAAITALDAGQFDEAIALFEACHEQFADMSVFARNLAEALARAALAEHERNARCTLCLVRLSRAIELAPEREDLARLLARWKSEAQVEQNFWRESSLHFELSYDGERSDLLWGSTRLLDALERAYTDLGELFAFYPVESGRAKFRVVLYERAGFSLLTGLGDWAGGAFDGSAIRIPIGDLAAEEARLERVFRHELCHAFVRELGGDSVPGWLNEGLAQWLEHQSDSQRAAAADAASAALAGTLPLPLSDLSGSLAGWKDEAVITRAYRQSLGLTGYLWRQHGQRAVLAMLLGCKQGQAPAASFEQEARLSLDDALAAWSQARK